MWKMLLFCSHSIAQRNSENRGGDIIKAGGGELKYFNLQRISLWVSTALEDLPFMLPSEA